MFKDHCTPTSTFLERLKARIFGVKYKVLEVTPDGNMELTAYRYRGTLYVTKERWTARANF